MGLAIKAYEAFKDDEKKAKLLFEVVDELKKESSLLSRFPKINLYFINQDHK
jgi:hypothetical protein